MSYKIARFCVNGHDTVVRGRQNSGQCVKCNRNSLKKSVDERKELIWSIKQSNTCVDCKEFYHPCQMQFDHLFSKKFGIGLNYKVSWDELLIEMAKCQLVCSNCHRLRTYRRAVNF